MSVSWRVDYYWELCYCFSLAQEFLWHICLYISPMWKHLRRQHTVFCQPLLVIFLPIFWGGLPVCCWAIVLCSRSSAVQEGPWALLGTSSCFLLARDLTRQETAQHSVCPCKLFKKKFNPGLVSCDLAIDWIRIHQNNITQFCTVGYDTME